MPTCCVVSSAEVCATAINLTSKNRFFTSLCRCWSKKWATPPLLAEQADQVAHALADEEARFGETLNQGMELLKKELGDVSGTTLPGDVAFKLYDTYGFPVDLTADVARELGMEVDLAGFDEAMDAQRARARCNQLRYQP